MIPLIGYTNALSFRPGETVEVKVSSTLNQSYRAELVRIISGDPNPEGPGMVFEPVASEFEGKYPSRPQTTHLGSYMAAMVTGPLPSAFILSATIWTTTPNKPGQGLLTLTNSEGAAILSLEIGPEGLSCEGVSTGTKLERWQWYHLTAEIDSTLNFVRVVQKKLATDETVTVKGTLSNLFETNLVVGVRIGTSDPSDRTTHFNGKIEAPAISTKDVTLAAWDFSLNMSSMTVPGAGSLASDGRLHGAPARAMTGSNWGAVEMDWTRDPEQWGAVHFHDDDIADCGWETDFAFAVPAQLHSGVYGIKISGGKYWDIMPIFVCPLQDKRTADICLVISTFTYVIYTNQARADFGEHWRDRAAAWRSFPYNPVDYPDYGLSTYNDHEDGSGICMATWHRPILNLRPGYHPFADKTSASGLRHFPADTHILAWLENRGTKFDVVTDWELHHEGASVLDGYKAILTTSHPEYHTLESLNAFRDYRNNGGNLIYVGGNGFYWRVALHPEIDGLIELRRAEGGLRAWAADPGEYYHAADGTYGGLWRRNGRPPNELVGVGYTVQGNFEGTYYRRTDASYEANLAWMFDGIEDEIIGDFGFSGGGAAGYELDRTEPRLGTPEDAIIVAVSENHPDHFVMPPEQWLTHVKTWSGPPEKELIRADMVYFKVPGGGQVFSTGSITFTGSLPWNHFENNISRLLENVVRRFIA